MCNLTGQSAAFKCFAFIGLLAAVLHPSTAHAFIAKCNLTAEKDEKQKATQEWTTADHKRAENPKDPALKAAADKAEERKKLLERDEKFLKSKPKPRTFLQKKSRCGTNPNGRADLNKMNKMGIKTACYCDSDADGTEAAAKKDLDGKVKEAMAKLPTSEFPTIAPDLSPKPKTGFFWWVPFF